MSSNTIHLHLIINVMTCYMHTFLHPSPSQEVLPSVPSSLSLKLKSHPNTLNYAFIGLKESFPMILANDVNP